MIISTDLKVIFITQVNGHVSLLDIVTGILAYPERDSGWSFTYITAVVVVVVVVVVIAGVAVVVVLCSPFLVECADAGVRKFFADFLLVVFTAFAEHFQSPVSEVLQTLTTSIH